MKIFTTNLIEQGNGIGFDVHHYIKILKARTKAGLPKVNTNITFDHPLIGRRLRCKKEGTIYTIKSCKKQWWMGWYYGFIIEQDNGSGSFIAYEQDKDLPTCCSLTSKHIKEHRENFELLD